MIRVRVDRGLSIRSATVSNMQIIIVDERDNPVGVSDRTSLQPTDIYRVAALWITNSKSEILLAQRALDKENDPGKWGPAVAGTLEDGETYLSNIIKEAQEEIGLENVEPTIGEKKFRKHVGRASYFVQWYSLKIDKDIFEFKLNHEVPAIKWFSKEELKNLLQEYPVMFLNSIKEKILE